MKRKPEVSSERDSRLREYAEAAIARKPKTPRPGKPMEELLHELQVHQVELEMQNDELRRTQVALEESRDRYVDLYEFAPVGYLMLSREGLILELNLAGASLLGVERKRVVDRRFASFIVGEDVDRFHQAFLGLLKHDERRTLEVKLRGPRGPFSARLDCLSMSTGDGALRLRVSMTDITDRVLLEQQTQDQSRALADLHRRKDEFMATLSHELRNPLAALANAGELLALQEGIETAVQFHARTIVQRQVEQLRHLVDDLLEVSRITSGRMQLKLERLDLNQVVERAVETVRPLIDQRKHVLSVVPSSRPAWVSADASRLEQVVVNLLTNAAKYSADEARIRVAVSQEPESCLLEVRDTGDGIAPELLPRIFELFTQGKRSLERAQGGLGIGLSLVQRLVELHGGRVEARSTLGQGSEFVVSLPRIELPVPLSPPAGPDRGTATARGSLRLLVVDDNADTASSLAMLLEASGNHTRTCYDGASAVAQALEYRPHAVLLDIAMPGMNGFEVAKRLRQAPGFENVVLIAITGFGQITDHELTRDAGFNRHLVKPIVFEELLAILETVTRAQVYGEVAPPPPA